MEAPPIYQLPQDTLHHIFSALPLRQIVICRSVSKFFHQILISPCFVALISAVKPPLRLLALRPSHHRHASPHPALHAFDPDANEWLRFPLAFLLPALGNPHPVASSSGLVYFWADSPDSSNKSLIACNPLTGLHRALPLLGSAWSRHGSVLVDSANRVLVLTQLATFFFCGSDSWLKFPSNLPSKPRSPVVVSNSAYALCDVGSPWRNEWKLFSCSLDRLQKWKLLERHEWGDVFDILKRPRLIRGMGNRILMVGGLKSTFSLNGSCSTILILKLDLGSLEWEEAGRMPPDMYGCFQESSKFKVFGAGNRVCFSAKRIGKLALWDCSTEQGEKGEWRWIDGARGNEDGLHRGFVFEASLPALP